MKFQKGILTEPGTTSEPLTAIPINAPEPKAKHILREVEKDRLFETQQEFAGSSNRYLKVLAVCAVAALAGVMGFFYIMQPGIGDQVKAPADLENAIREHFSTVQKRNATDVVAYKCDGFYWIRVAVETRTDIPNPVYRIASYAATAKSDTAGSWAITASPETSGPGTPCQ